jgi:hypothetical protein
MAGQVKADRCHTQPLHTQTGRTRHAGPPLRGRASAAGRRGGGRGACADPSGGGGGGARAVSEGRRRARRRRAPKESASIWLDWPSLPTPTLLAPQRSAAARCQRHRCRPHARRLAVAKIVLRALPGGVCALRDIRLGPPRVKRGARSMAALDSAPSGNGDMPTSVVERTETLDSVRPRRAAARARTGGGGCARRMRAQYRGRPCTLLPARPELSNLVARAPGTRASVGREHLAIMIIPEDECRLQARPRRRARGYGPVESARRRRSTSKVMRPRHGGQRGG